MVEATLTESSQRWNNTRGPAGGRNSSPNPGSRAWGAFSHPMSPSILWTLPPSRGATISAHRQRWAEVITLANGVILKGWEQRPNISLEMFFMFLKKKQFLGKPLEQMNSKPLLPSPACVEFALLAPLSFIFLRGALPTPLPAPGSSEQPGPLPPACLSRHPYSRGFR